MPALSETEKAVLMSGDVGWEGEIFRGKLDFNRLLKIKQPTLTKKEKDFLLDWLSDDLHLELEKRREQDEQSPIVRKYLPKIILNS